MVSVQHRSRSEPQWENYTFFSGHIAHGRQFVQPDRRQDTNIAYWGPNTGCRKAVEYKMASVPACRIGIVGMGVGTIAAFADGPEDYVRMYEINSQVVDIANRYFTFLKDCPAKQDIVLGDARLQLERELADTNGQGHQFDLLCLDAFSGDAVPTHLLTTEAFALYKKHLKPDGIIVVNITNTYLDLYPVVRGLAEEHHFKHTRLYKPAEPERLIYRTYFVLVTNDETFLQQTPEELVEMPAGFRRERHVPLWTDRYHSLFQILQ
jgi:spermidine synthase